MALRKPLVLANGTIEQLQSGDTLDGTAQNPNVINLTNANANAITIGQPVYSSAADSVDLADASAAGSAKPIGLVQASSIASSTTGAIQLDGVLSSSDWTAVVGSQTLTSGATYFLDTTAGQMTSTAPSSGYITEIGVALSTTEIAIDIKTPIKL